MRGVKSGVIRMTISHRFRKCQKIGKKIHLNMNYVILNTISFFKNIINFAENYNIENAIPSRHMHARCQEWCHSNDNFT